MGDRKKQTEIRLSGAIVEIRRCWGPAEGYSLELVIVPGSETDCAATGRVRLDDAEVIIRQPERRTNG